MIRFQCQCGRLLDVGDQFAGKQVRCPSCQQVAHVPLATSPVAPTIPAAVPAPVGFEGTGLPPMSQRDLNHERHIRAIAFWDCAFGVLFLLGGFCGIAGTGFAATQGGGAAAAMMGGFSAIYLVLGGASFAVGLSLWRYKGWARWVQFFLCALFLLNSLKGLNTGSGVIGLLFTLAWYGAILWALLSVRAATICTPSYQELVSRTPQERVTWWTSPFFWVPLAFVALGCVAGIFLAGAFGAMMR